MLRQSKGNMYEFVTHTFNPIKGKCFHNCPYCYMKRWGEQKPLRLDRKELKTDLGKGNFIFVGSSTDMFAADVPEEWIFDVIYLLKKFDNKYLLQTKNPERLFNLLVSMSAVRPEQFVFATTIETNRGEIRFGDAPDVRRRSNAMARIAMHGFKTMVTCEPIIDFDVPDLTSLILLCDPEQINIGADSGGNGLPEPSPEKIQQLIESLERCDIKKVVKKKNLARIYMEAQP